MLLTYAVPEADCLRKLSDAIATDDEKAVETFLQKPYDPNSAVMDVACLSVAAYHGSLKSAKLLFEARAHVAGGERAGMSPLHATCHRGHSDFARWLLESKADVAETFTDGRLTTAALHLACARGHLELLEVLVEGGADVNQLPPGQGSLTLSAPLYSGTRKLISRFHALKPKTYALSPHFYTSGFLGRHGSHSSFCYNQTPKGLLLR